MHTDLLPECIHRQVSKVPPVEPASATAVGSSQSHRSGQGQQKQLKAQALPTPKAVPKQTHAELMAQIRQADEPLSVGGELTLLYRHGFKIMLSKLHATELGIKWQG